MPIRGFFIIVVDSWRRQLTAGRDSTRQYSFQINTQLVESYLHFYSGCRFRIVRHSEESTFPAGTTPQGFRNQHSPLTMFRTVEVLLLSLSIALQRQVFTYKITITRGSRWLLRRFLLFVRNFWIHSGHFRDLEQSQDEIAIARAFCTACNLFLTYPIMATAYPNWMFFLSWFVFEFWKAGGFIARQVERSSDRQVALNCHCEGHFVFFLTNQQVCLSISIY